MQPSKSFYHACQLIKAKAVIESVKNNSNIQTTTSMSLEIAGDETSSESSFEGFQNIENNAGCSRTNCVFWEGRINNTNAKCQQQG